MTENEPAGLCPGQGEGTANRFLALLRSPRPRPLLIAHRGDSAHAPENTLEAARAGWEAGADAWELDVRLTRDGIPVVLHDESLARTTDVADRFPDDSRAGADYLVSEFDFDEVRSLDAGRWFLSDRGGPRTAKAFRTRDRLRPEAVARFSSGEVRVPSLRESLDLTARLDWLVNVELKPSVDHDPRALLAVVREIDSLEVADRVILSSFDHGVVGRASARRPALATAVVTETPLSEPHRYFRDVVLADCYHLSALAMGAGSRRYLRGRGPAHLRTDDIPGLARCGVPVLVYTVNDARADGLAAHLAQAGVAGLFTDDPESLVGRFAKPPN